MDLLTLIVLAEHHKIVRYQLPDYLDHSGSVQLGHAVCIAGRLLKMARRDTATEMLTRCEEDEIATTPAWMRCRWCNHLLSDPACPDNPRNDNG